MYQWLAPQTRDDFSAHAAVTQVYGVYQIGDVQARFWVIIGTSDDSSLPLAPGLRSPSMATVANDIHFMSFPFYWSGDQLILVFLYRFCTNLQLLFLPGYGLNNQSTDDTLDGHSRPATLCQVNARS